MFSREIPASSALVPSCELHQPRRKFIVIVAAAITILAYPFLEKSWTPSSPPLSLPSETTEIHSAARPLQAEDIIRRSYGQTFGALSTETLCSPDVEGKTCITSLLNEATGLSSFLSNNNNMSSFSPIKSFPWWFVTMLRDANSNSVHASWHNLTFLEPPMDFCTIEKIATTQWRNVQCFVNEGENKKFAPKPCPLNKTVLDSRRPDRVSRAVMLRDPLERLLSGYLAKCVHPLRRMHEGSCEPNSVFNETDMTLQIREDPQQLFAAYVDGFPLKWNLHFFPQSMYCNVLFRHVGNYDFVGKMDGDFFGNLQHFSKKMGQGNRLPDALEEVFDLSSELNAGHGNSNVGRETRAAMHVKTFFTAASVRRALEYFAVDYVMLGLEIPAWVHDILAEDNELFAK